VEAGGQLAAIASLDSASAALEGSAGTIVRMAHDRAAY
jgi:carbamate kinase